MIGGDRDDCDEVSQGVETDHVEVSVGWCVAGSAGVVAVIFIQRGENAFLFGEGYQYMRLL